jgi:hypothetical protein
MKFNFSHAMFTFWDVSGLESFSKRYHLNVPKTLVEKKIEIGDHQ